jgi:hypothetical protein
MTVADEIQYGVDSIRRGRNRLFLAYRLGGFASAGSLATVTLSQDIEDLTGLLADLKKARAALIDNTPAEFRRAS